MKPNLGSLHTCLSKVCNNSVEAKDVQVSVKMLLKSPIQAGTRTMKIISAACMLMTTVTLAQLPALRDVARPRIGAVETVTEKSSSLEFMARIDTGATSCSIHCEALEIDDPAAAPDDNIGKPIRFLVTNKRGQSEWLESVIADRVKVRTSERSADRYKVRLTLRCLDVEKSVLVTLNDRSTMRYPVLIGRNFLQDDFVVDVGSGGKTPG
jgi:hypothetical protein